MWGGETTSNSANTLNKTDTNKTNPTKTDPNKTTPDTNNTTPTTNSITGSLGKGKALEAKVEAYDLNNTLLGKTTTIKDGNYSIDIGKHTGVVRVVAKLKKYLDENLQKEIVVDNLELQAYSVVTKGKLVVNISAISDMSAKLIKDSNLSLSATTVSMINRYLSTILGISKDDITKLKQKYLKPNSGVVNSTPANKKAFVLFAISSESNLTQDDNPAVVKAKVEDTLKRYYDAIILESRDSNNTQLDTLLESNLTTTMSDTNLIKDVDIDSTTLIPTNYKKEIEEIMHKIKTTKEKKESGKSINNIPIATLTTLTLQEDTTKRATLTAFDIDRDDTLTFSIVTQPQHATLTLETNGSFSYTPNPNFNGSDYFTYRVNDGKDDSLEQNVTITVTNINDAPTPTFTTLTLQEDSTKRATLTATDVDSNSSSLTFSITTQPRHGTLSLETNRSFTYTPNPNFNGSDYFTYKVNDGVDDSVEQNVTIRVTAVNDTPVPTFKTLTEVKEDTTGKREF